MFAEIGKYHYENDPKLKEEIGETLFKETAPFYLEKLDAQAKQNGGYLVGGHVST